MRIEVVGPSPIVVGRRADPNGDQCLFLSRDESVLWVRETGTHRIPELANHLRLHMRDTARGRVVRLTELI